MCMYPGNDCSAVPPHAMWQMEGSRRGEWVSGFLPHVVRVWHSGLLCYYFYSQSNVMTTVVSELEQFLENGKNKHWQTGQTDWVYFPLFSRIMGWRLRIWKLFLINWTHLPRTCRTSSQTGGAAAITTAEPPTSCPTTSLPPWWTWSLRPKAFWRGWTGEICEKVHL